MKDDHKTKKQLINELTELRSQNSALEKSITERISAELAAEEAHRYAEGIVETVREPLLVLDADLRIISANRHFYRTFQVTPGETIGSFIYDLGNKQWNIPKLRELLEEILPEKETFDDFEVSHNFEDIGHKIMLLNARQIYRKYIGTKMILLAIEDITERKQLEDMLTESEERYRRLFETASDGIVLLEKREGKITHANPAAEKMLGYTKQESIGNKLQDIGVLLDLGDFRTTMQHLNESGILNYNNVPAKTKSGQHIDTDIYLVDKARLVQCNIRDITKHKLEEEYLRKSEETYRLVVDNMSDVITILDMNLRFTYVSPSIIRLRGYTVEEVMEQTLEQVMTPESLQIVASVFEEEMKLEAGGMADHDRIRILELEEYKKDGSTVWLENRMSALRNKENKIVGIITLSHDITTRKQTEDRIKKQTDAMEAAMDGMAILNEGGEYIYLNQAHARIYGYENAGELIGKSWRILYDADELQRFDAEIMPNFGQNGYWQGEALGMKQDGSKFPQEISLTALESGGLICVVRDITEGKQAEDALRSKQMMLARTEGIAHIGSWVWNIATDKVTWSDELFRIFQRDPREGAPSFAEHPAFYHPEDMARLRQAVEAAITDGTSYELELRAIRKDGETRVCVARGIPEMELGGRTVSLFGSLQDITERKRAEEELRGTLERLRRAFGTTIQVMVSAVESRDPYTAGHQLRSADLARAVATEMGLSQEKIDGLRMAGSIHDIGKLSVPAEILSKPTKLTDLEFSLIKVHPEQGYEMLKDVESPWPLAQIVYQHHERMDGSGYPRQLKGAEILMEARIMAVADVVESMASHRPYRPALGLNAALEEIEKNRGTLYDNAVVDACLRLFREKRYELE